MWHPFLPPRRWRWLEQPTTIVLSACRARRSTVSHQLVAPLSPEKVPQEDSSAYDIPSDSKNPHEYQTIFQVLLANTMRPAFPTRDLTPGLVAHTSLQLMYPLVLRGPASPAGQFCCRLCRTEERSHQGRPTTTTWPSDPAQ